MRVSFTSFWLMWAIAWGAASLSAEHWGARLTCIVVASIGGTIVALRIDEGRAAEKRTRFMALPGERERS